MGMNKQKYDEGYSTIDWTKKIPKKFKTSWGAEYTVWVKENRSKKSTGKTIDQLTGKNTS
jgi:hypothetical protein